MCGVWLVAGTDCMYIRKWVVVVVLWEEGEGVGIVGRESTRFAFDGVKEGTYQVGIVQDAILLFK